MRALAFLAAAACGLACAPLSAESPLPPAAEAAPPSAPAGGAPDAIEEVHPHTETLQDVPRIGVIRGRIVAKEGDKLAVRGRALAGDQADVSMFVGPVTHVTIDGRAAKSSDLRQGMEVRASYTEDRSTVIADRVDALSP